MISLLKRRFRRVLATGKPLARLTDTGGCPVHLQHAIIDTLIEAKTSDTIVHVRDIHSLVGISQPEALRCTKRLEERGVVKVEESIHDPLSSIVRLK